MPYRNDIRYGLVGALAVLFAFPLGAQESRLMPVPQELVCGKGSRVIRLGAQSK